MYVCIVAPTYVRYSTVHQSCGLVIRVMLGVQYQRAQKGERLTVGMLWLSSWMRRLSWAGLGWWVRR